MTHPAFEPPRAGRGRLRRGVEWPQGDARAAPEEAAPKTSRRQAGQLQQEPGLEQPEPWLEQPEELQLPPPPPRGMEELTTKPMYEMSTVKGLACSFNCFSITKVKPFSSNVSSVSVGSSRAKLSLGPDQPPGAR